MHGDRNRIQPSLRQSTLAEVVEEEAAEAAESRAPHSPCPPALAHAQALAAEAVSRGEKYRADWAGARGPVRLPSGPSESAGFPLSAGDSSRRSKPEPPPREDGL